MVTEVRLEDERNLHFIIMQQASISQEIEITKVKGIILAEKCYY